MQNFLATLAQTSATLIGIFLAAVIAYFVFLSERIATFAVQKDAAQVDIGSELSRLNAAWPQSLGFFVPPQFRDRYRQAHPDKSETGLISQLTTDLLFHRDELVNVVRDVVAPNAAQGPWSGRLYAYALTEVTRTLGGGAPGVFPASPGGPGFDQWRDTFKQLQGSIDILRMWQSTMIADFQPYMPEPPPYENQTRKTLIDAAEKFFTTLQRTQEKLDQIDKVSLFSQRYSLANRMAWWSLIVTSALWFILGIALPLGLLAFPRYDITPLAAIAILVGTSLFAIVAVVQFGMSFKEKPFDWTNYIKQRWYNPIFAQLDGQDAILTNGGIIDTRRIYEALNSGERSRFDADVIARLDSYLKTATQYNEMVRRLNAAVVAAIRADRVLGPLVAGYESLKGGPVLYPYEFVAEEQRFMQLMDGWGRGLPSSDQDISVETLGPGWSRVELKLPGGKLYQDPAEARSAFERVRTDMLGTEIARELLDALKSVQESSRHVREVMEAKLRG